MTAGRILVVEDDPDIVTVVKAYLERESYQVEVAKDGPSGLQCSLAAPPDLIVLDWMLPGLSGLELLKRLRRERETPIIMLTARGEQADRILGLEFGADDYVNKPFDPLELVARVRAVLRRARRQEATDEPLVVGPLRIDPVRRQVEKLGVPVELTTLEFDLLYTLAANPGRVWRRDELLDRVWGQAFIRVDRVVDVHVSNLRQKLETDPENPHYLLTVRGVGYKFAEEVV